MLRQRARGCPRSGSGEGLATDVYPQSDNQAVQSDNNPVTIAQKVQLAIAVPSLYGETILTDQPVASCVLVSRAVFTM